MPASRALGRGHLLRPLLTASRAELEAYAAAHQLHWVEDPSNGDVQYSRNYLRQQVLPVLKQRWPQAATSMARTAEHLREAQDLLDDLARLDLANLSEPARFAWLTLPSLPLAPLLALSVARQRNLLRYWLAPMTALPDSDHWAGWCDLRDAGLDAAPIWKLADGELHRADGRLWWLSGQWLRPLDPLDLPCDRFCASVELPGNGHVHLQGELPQGVAEQWNASRRFARLSLQGEFLVMEMDVVVAAGVSNDHLRGNLELWDRLLQEFIVYLREYSQQAAQLQAAAVGEEAPVL